MNKILTLISSLSVEDLQDPEVYELVNGLINSIDKLDQWGTGIQVSHDQALSLKSEIECWLNN